jgi:drug/metabolite transporter (DMT)-like permease
MSASLGRAVFTGRLVAATHPISPLVLAQMRATVSLAVLAPILLITRGRSAFRMERRDLWIMLALGILGMAASNYFYYLAIQKTNVATAIILQYTAPMWVLIYMIARRLQHPTAGRIGSVALAIIGIALVIGIIGPANFALNTVGVVAAELAALSFAFYNVVAGSMLERYDRWRVLLFVLIGATLLWVIVNPPWRVVAAHYSGAQWAFLCVFAVTSILIPFSLYFAGLQCLDATRAIVTSCLEPVFSIVIAATFLGELMGKWQVVGIVLVLASTVIVQLPDRTKPERAVVVEPIE